MNENRGRLRLLLDTADVAAFAQWMPTGLFHGVTTNPTILAASKIPSTPAEIARLAAEAFRLGAAEVQAQTWGRTSEALLANGLILAAIDPRIVVKVPITEAGALAAKQLKQAGIRVTLTAVYAAHQALSAAALGADYAAPYLGRMNDAGRDGFAEIEAMQAIVSRTGSSMRILVASLRQVEDLARLAALGIDTFTFSPKVAAALFADPLTEAAAEVFEQAAVPG